MSILLRVGDEVKLTFERTKKISTRRRKKFINKDGRRVRIPEGALLGFDGGLEVKSGIKTVVNPPFETVQLVKTKLGLSLKTSASTKFFKGNSVAGVVVPTVTPEQTILLKYVSSNQTARIMELPI